MIQIEELEKSRNEAGTVKQIMWSVHCFQAIYHETACVTGVASNS